VRIKPGDTPSRSTVHISRASRIASPASRFISRARLKALRARCSHLAGDMRDTRREYADTRGRDEYCRLRDESSRAQDAVTSSARLGISPAKPRILGVRGSRMARGAVTRWLPGRSVRSPDPATHRTHARFSPSISELFRVQRKKSAENAEFPNCTVEEIGRQFLPKRKNTWTWGHVRGFRDAIIVEFSRHMGFFERGIVAPRSRSGCTAADFGQEPVSAHRCGMPSHAVGRGLLRYSRR
jgi:hypothetical protein